MSIRARNAHFTNWAKVIEALQAAGYLIPNNDVDVARAFLKDAKSSDGIINPFYYMVCFIKETQEIYTHGEFYDCSYARDEEGIAAALSSLATTKVGTDNLKTINGQSLIGSGDISSVGDVKYAGGRTVNGDSLYNEYDGMTYALPNSVPIIDEYYDYILATTEDLQPYVFSSFTERDLYYACNGTSFTMSVEDSKYIFNPQSKIAYFKDDFSINASGLYVGYSPSHDSATFIIGESIYNMIIADVTANQITITGGVSYDLSDMNLSLKTRIATASSGDVLSLSPWLLNVWEPGVGKEYSIAFGQAPTDTSVYKKWEMLIKVGPVPSSDTVATIGWPDNIDWANSGTPPTLEQNCTYEISFVNNWVNGELRYCGVCSKFNHNA